MDAKLFFWELPPARKWQGKKLGEMRIVPYENGTKSQLVFMPTHKDSLKMNYCLQYTKCSKWTSSVGVVIFFFKAHSLRLSLKIHMHG
jgi:hypothetical protein